MSAALHLGVLSLHAAPTFTSLASFYATNGANPSAALVQGADGLLYGTTSVGGTEGQGTVFKMTAAGAITPLASFAKTNGANPGSRPLPASDGFLYGTTAGGGASNQGTIFRIGSDGTLTSLFSFGGTNGSRPRALIQTATGLLYGTTESGGASDQGTVFSCTTGGSVSRLASFDNSGYSPYGELVEAPDSLLYGVAFLGGANGFGAAYRISTNGGLNIVHAFTGAAGGGNPYGGLTLASDGNLYGTTAYGGAYGYGTVFRLSTNGNFAVVASFAQTNGAYPQGTLVQAADGFLYGTTQAGGYTNLSATGYGTIFRVSLTGELNAVAAFAGTNGAYPLAGLLKASDGALYGTTSNGGAENVGTVFRVTIDQPPRPEITTISRDGADVTLTWKSVVGLKYQVQHKSSLNQAAWLPLGSIAAAQQSVTAKSLTAPDTQGFFRIAVMP